jgi:hypothetical protein
LSLPLLAVQSVTWVKVEKPVFDLVGVVLSSIGIAAICVGVALAFGSVLGLVLILRNRKLPVRSWDDDCIHLLEARRLQARQL